MRNQGSVFGNEAEDDHLKNKKKNNVNNEEEEEEEEDGEKMKKKKKRKKEQQNKVSFFKLFSFADFYDYLLMGAGSIGACIHGASVPVFFIYFGKLINIIGMAYLFPEEAAPKVAKVIFKLHFIVIYRF